MILAKCKSFFNAQEKQAWRLLLRTNKNICTSKILHKYSIDLFSLFQAWLKHFDAYSRDSEDASLHIFLIARARERCSSQCKCCKSL